MTENIKITKNEYLKRLAISIIDDSPVLMPRRTNDLICRKRKPHEMAHSHNVMGSKWDLIKVSSQNKSCDQSLSELSKFVTKPIQITCKRRELKLANKEGACSISEASYRYMRVKSKRHGWHTKQES
jgi:hypothetical protein